MQPVKLRLRASANTCNEAAGSCYFYCSICGVPMGRIRPESDGPLGGGDFVDGVSGGGAAVVASVSACDIWLSKKNTELTRFACVTTAKSPGVHSQSSHKINDGKYKVFLLLLSLKKRRR